MNNLIEICSLTVWNNLFWKYFANKFGSSKLTLNPVNKNNN